MKLIMLAVLIVVLWTLYSCVAVGSDADDRARRMYNESKKDNLKKK